MVEAQIVASAEGVSIRRSFPQRMEIFSVGRSASEVLEGFEADLGIVFPRQPNRSIGRTPRILSVAPGRWIVFDAVLPKATAVSGWHAADVAQGHVAYDIEGYLGADLLSKGCPVDLHPQAFGGPDACATTLLGQCEVLIDQLSAGHFRLYAEASYAFYLDLWFGDATVEFETGQRA